MNKKMRARKRRQARRVALTLVLMLTVALVSIGGTIAWLTDSTGEIKNTFTVGNIDIDLYEMNGTSTKDRDGAAFDLTPGSAYVKDPRVVVEANSEACYLFVKVDTAGDIDYVEYELNTDGWTELTKDSGIYYRTVEASTSEQGWYLLKNEAELKDADGKDVNGSVKISTSLTKEILDSTANPFEAPSITFTAYAVQQDNLTAQEAWNVAQGKNPDGTTPGATA